MAHRDGEGPSPPDVIRHAIGTIRDGLFEINEQLLNVRGILSKDEVLKLHQRLKEMRDTAEQAEDAFRDWTVELTGQVFAEPQRILHGELRREFEIQVAAVQTCMARVGNEVARRKAHKKSEKFAKQDLESDEKSSSSTSSAVGAETKAPIASAPEKSSSADIEALRATAARAEAQLKPAQELPTIGGFTSAGPPAAQKKQSSTPATAATPARSQQPGVTKAFEKSSAASHASMASVLKQMESNEQELVSSFDVVAHGNKGGLSAAKKSQIRDRINRLKVNPMFKYLLFVCACVVGYMVYSHARYLVLQSELPVHKVSGNSEQAKSYRTGILRGDAVKGGHV